MQAFIDAALAWPTAVWSLLLVVVVLYWAFVIFGALDVDVLEVDGALDGLGEGVDGALDGALDGVAEGVDGALDGVADGVADGIDGALDGADGALDGADGALDGADGALDGAHHAVGGLLGVLHALKLRSAPLTVVISFLVLFSWILSYAGMQALAGPLGGLAIPVVGLAAFALAIPLTSLTVRPLGPMFKTEQARSRKALIGRTCTVTTGRVDARFGQADCQVDTDHLLIQVRYRGAAAPTRGQEVLIVDYDPAEEAYVIEPIDQAQA